MPRDAQPEEVRVLRALRQINVITGTQFDQARTLLEATEACQRCGGVGWLGVDGNPASPEQDPTARPCPRCDATGEQRVIR